MTGVLDVDEVAPSSNVRVTTPREVWRRARLPLVLALAIVLIAVVRAITTGAVSSDLLDPDAAGPQGGRALAVLLRNHGIDVRRVEAPSGAPGTTAFIPVPELVTTLRPSGLLDAADAPSVVVVAPSNGVLSLLHTGTRVVDEVEPRGVQPACAQPDAVAAGDVLLGGTLFTGDGCYAIHGHPSFVDVTASGRRVALLGDGSFLTNDHLAQRGNAALALRLLLRQPTVEWVYPREPADADTGEGRGLLSLLPHRLFVLLAELLVAVGLLVLWRARRLGPVVAEPLPVVVRAAEAVEGRARLYAAAHARDRAAYALRAGLRDRLVHVLGLSADAGPETLVAAVTARTGRDHLSVSTLLYGPPPADDAALVRLADDLDRLDSEVRAL